MTMVNFWILGYDGEQANCAQIRSSTLATAQPSQITQSSQQVTTTNLDQKRVNTPISQPQNLIGQALGSISNPSGSISTTRSTSSPKATNLRLAKIDALKKYRPNPMRYPFIIE